MKALDQNSEELNPGDRIAWASQHGHTCYLKIGKIISVEMKKVNEWSDRVKCVIKAETTMVEPWTWNGQDQRKTYVGRVESTRLISDDSSDYYFAQAVKL